MKKVLNVVSAVIVMSLFSSVTANAATCNGPGVYPYPNSSVTMNYALCGYVTKLSSVSPYYAGPTHSYKVAVCVADSMGNPPASADSASCGTFATGYDGTNQNWGVFFAPVFS